MDERAPTDPPGAFSAPAAGTAVSRVLTLVFTDLAGSLALKRKLGDAGAGEVIRRHFGLLRARAAETGGREVFEAGDGLFLTFETPTAAVEFALKVQSDHAADPSLPKLRIGAHLGEITERHPPPGVGPAGPPQVEGLASDLAAAIQALAIPGQILLSYPTFDNARQRLRADRLPGVAIAWRAHGVYHFKGHEAPVALYEAGLEAWSPLIPPPDTERAHRQSDASGETSPGWRPARGMTLPARPNWVLAEKLGEGGFGDVWLAEQAKTRERRVIKFCYSLEKLQALKHEATLFRVLRDALGDRDDIARVIDFQFDEPPYYLEMEYAGRGTLEEWAKECGGLEAVPLETRLAIVASVADAVAAAHSVGVLHKDVKPSNILVTAAPEGGAPRIRVIDFGLGMLAERGLLARLGISASGLGAVEGDGGSVGAGTQLYMAPELLEGRPPTTRSDVYSLGVLLYQMAAGDLKRALAAGWQSDVADALVREDIAACVQGRPDQRLGGAGDLAARLRDREARLEAVARDAEAGKFRDRRRRLARVYKVMAAVGAAATLLSAVIGWRSAVLARRESGLRESAEAARAEAVAQRAWAVRSQDRAEQSQYALAVSLAEVTLGEGRLAKALDLLLSDAPARLRNMEWGLLMARASEETFAIPRMNSFHAEYSPDGNLIATADLDAATSVTSGVVRFYDSRTGATRGNVVTNRLIPWALAFSPDGAFVATASHDKTAALVDVARRRVVGRMTGHTDILRAVCFSPDSRQVATGGRDGTLRVWDAATCLELRSHQSPGEAFTCIRWSPDGRWLLSSALGGIVRIWDATTSNSLVAELAGHEQSVSSCDFSPDGRSIATTCRDGFVRLFTSNSDGTWTSGTRAMKTWKTRNTFPQWVSMAGPGPTIAVACDDGTGRIYNVGADAATKTVRADEQAWKIGLSRDGARFVVTTRWNVKAFDALTTVTATAIQALAPGQPAPTSGPQGAFRVKAPGMVPVRDVTWDLGKLWNPPTGMTIVRSGKQTLAVESFYSSFSPDGGLRARIDDATLSATVVEVATGREVATLGGGAVAGIAFSPDGRYLACTGLDRGVTMWDTSLWRPAWTDDHKGGYPEAPSFDVTGSRVAVGFSDGRIIVWNSSSGARVGPELNWTKSRALCTAFSPDGTRLVSGHSNERGRVWDLRTGDSLTTLVGHSRYIHQVAWTPDSRRILTVARDGKAKLWDADTGRELATVFETPPGINLLGAYVTPGMGFIVGLTDELRVIRSELFPWSDDALPALPGAGFAKRLELWKRRAFLDPAFPAESLGGRW